MDTLRQRSKDDPKTISSNGGGGGNKTRRDKKLAMAKRGVRSLAIAVSVPLSLTLASIYLHSPRDKYLYLETPFWFPSLWAKHVACLASSLLMSLSAWLVWAEGGFHRQPTAIPFYLGYVGLSLAWDPVVFSLGAPRMGLVICVGVLGSLVGCLRSFRQVNLIAANLVKPVLVSGVGLVEPITNFVECVLFDRIGRTNNRPSFDCQRMKPDKTLPPMEEMRID
ncbi:hypothetical protein GIB67_039454 [Kingdonia uniflora]|uniref:Uncharacterized protein n=1 Tax=Kingdonia uniflora TaxID=39325 RepID=A0A7J7LIZ1_9MAGN|nr:hypothetical protein GIB67_039454 [Kingdonia uniflora]